MICSDFFFQNSMINSQEFGLTVAEKYLNFQVLCNQIKNVYLQLKG